MNKMTAEELIFIVCYSAGTIMFASFVGWLVTSFSA